MAQVFGTEMSEYELVKFWRNANLVGLPHFIRTFSILVKGRYDAIDATNTVANRMANDWDDILNKVDTDYDVYNEIMLEGTIKANSWFEGMMVILARDLPENEAIRVAFIEYSEAIISYEEFLACMIEKYVSEADFNKYLEAEAMREWADILED